MPGVPRCPGTPRQARAHAERRPARTGSSKATALLSGERQVAGQRRTTARCRVPTAPTSQPSASHTVRRSRSLASSIECASPVCVQSRTGRGAGSRRAGGPSGRATSTPHRPDHRDHRQGNRRVSGDELAVLPPDQNSPCHVRPARARRRSHRRLFRHGRGGEIDAVRSARMRADRRPPRRVARLDRAGWSVAMTRPTPARRGGESRRAHREPQTLPWPSGRIPPRSREREPFQTVARAVPTLLPVPGRPRYGPPTRLVCPCDPGDTHRASPQAPS